MKIGRIVVAMLGIVLLTGCYGSSDVISEDINSTRIDDLTASSVEVDVPVWKRNRKDINIIFTGDVMLGRYVETLMNRNGLDYPFESVSGRLNLADEVIINLEGPVLRSAEHVQTPDNTTNFSFDEKVLSTFDRHNIGIVNLSNNHTYDKGSDRFMGMTNILSENGIEWFGHPQEYDNKYIHTINADGVDINLLGYHQATNPNFDIEAMKDSVSSVVEAMPNAVNIANFHFGPEYILTSSAIQKEIARAAIDAGADLVIGHHPHVVQEMEVYKGKPIFYSLGNFVFDQYFSQDTQEGLAVELVLEFKDFDSEFKFSADPYALLGGKYELDRLGVRLLPLRSNSSQPYFLGEEEYRPWLEQYATRSIGGSVDGEYFYEWTY